MTDEEQNRAICEAIGRRYHKPTPDEIKSGSYYQYEPDYLNDLNAMHEAEKRIVMPPIEKPFNDYINWLVKITGKINGGVDATARQRAEAFLRTIGKWHELPTVPATGKPITEQEVEEKKP